MPKQIKKYTGFFSYRYHAWHHVLFWLLYLSFASALIHIFGGRVNFSYLPANIVADTGLVYLNTFVLLPRFLLKGKYEKYLSYTLISLFICLIISFIGTNSITGEWFKFGWHNTVSKQTFGALLSLATLITAIAFKLFKEQLNSEERIHELERAKLEAELDFLKTQMNPHFLFNTLNGILVLTKTNPSKASETIIQLSDLLRYQTYECSGDQVLLSAEADYIKKYLNLQSLRFPEANIQFEMKGEIGGLTIFPFIFLPFVENAVKHGIEKSEKNGYIRIFIEVLNKKLLFFVENTNEGYKKHKKGGIGLMNIRRRLELLYPECYELEIKESEPLYSVKLNINLAQ